MIEKFLDLVNIVRVFIGITFIVALLRLKLTKHINKCLLAIISINFLCEIVNMILELKGIKTSISATIWVVFHDALWLYLLHYILNKKTVLIALQLFLLFATYNLLWLQRLDSFNYYSFIFGSIIYLSFYFFEIFKVLKDEDFTLLFSNKFILISAPVLFLFGMSLMFAFVSKEITQTIVFKKIKLYSFVNYFVNFIYYLLISTYIIKQKNEL